MNDTVIFLVLAGLALIFKWLTTRGSDEAEKPPSVSPDEPTRRTPSQTDEERVRRFLEALGVPPGTQTPPPIRSRTVTTRPVATTAPRVPSPKARRSWAQPLPPVVTTPAEMSAPAPVFVMPTQQLPAVPPPLPPEMNLRASAAPLARKATPARSLPTTSFRTMLRSRERLRQAIILREVLGPPRGLEPFGPFLGS